MSADDIKKLIPGYEPSRSHEFHRESARLADKAYEQALKTREEPEVILLSGGAASGKTEYASVYLQGKAVIIIVDGTLPSFEGAKIKIRKARRAGKTVSVMAVMPEDFKIAFSAFLGRERKLLPKYFFETHSKSRRALLEIAEEFPDIQITLVDSEYGQNGSLSFAEIVFDSRRALLELLRQRQYTEGDIRNRVFHAT